MVFTGVGGAHRLVGMALVASPPQGWCAIFIGVECEAGRAFVASASAMAADGNGRCRVDSARRLSGAAAGGQ